MVEGIWLCFSCDNFGEKKVNRFLTFFRDSLKKINVGVGNFFSVKYLIADLGRGRLQKLEGEQVKDYKEQKIARKKTTKFFLRGGDWGKSGAVPLVT